MKTFPVNLILEGKRCLVVGGGKVAVRKARLLHNSGATVVVVAPKMCEDLEEAGRVGRLQIVRRAFDARDLDGVAVVFATTDDKSLNAGVLRSCAVKGIPACAADSNWPHGAFITPASFEREGVTVAVSTSGASCRRSRLIKENLDRHLELASDAELLVVGADHNLLSISKREPLHLVDGRLDAVGGMLSCVWGIHEFMLLNTCNRIELIAVVSPGEGLERMIGKLLDFDRLPVDRYYVKRGLDAFGHLALVASGMMSQTPGEKHITSQLKRGLEHSKNKGWAGAMTREWVDSALRVAKRVRQEIEPLLINCEIEDVAVKYLLDGLPELSSKRALLLGSGIIGQGIAERLSRLGCRVEWIYHKTKPKVDPALKGQIEPRGLDELDKLLPGAEVIVATAAAPVHLLRADHAPLIKSAAQVLAIDLGTPRNISPELASLAPNLKVVNMDDLKHWHRRNLVDMPRLLEICSRIITSHAQSYEKIVESVRPKQRHAVS